MANATRNLAYTAEGEQGRIISGAVAEATHIYEGTMVAQDTTHGGIVPAGTANSGKVLGIAMHESNNVGGKLGDKQQLIATDRVYFINKAADIVATTPIGSKLYVQDDNSVKLAEAAGMAAGIFYGLAEDGCAKVFISPTVG